MNATVSKAYRWILEHPDEFKELQRIACRAAADPRCPRLKRGDVYLMAQRYGADVTLDGVFRRDNTLWSALARVIVSLHPETARVLETRRCDTGVWFEDNGVPPVPPRAVWHPGSVVTGVA